MKRPEQSTRSASGVTGEGTSARSAAAEPSAIDWAHRANAVDEVLAELAHRAARRRRRAAAGVAVAVLCLSSMVAWRLRTRLAPTAAPVSASVLQPAQQTLADGSVVELKEGATIAVAFTPEVRRVTLERGEAHFQVAKNPVRPFVVRVGRIEVRAVGTAFSVVSGERAAEVLVTEGTVAVQAPRDSTGHGAMLPVEPETLALLGAGKRLVIDVNARALAPGAIQAVSGAEMAERLAWRVPRLEFSGTPLIEAITMFNRHNRVQLRLADATLGTLKISGFLRADRTETFLRLLESDFGLVAEHTDATEIVLRRAP